MTETNSSHVSEPDRRMMIAWFAIVVVVLGGGSVYLGWRLIAPFHLPLAGRIAAWSALLLTIILPIASMILMRTGMPWRVPLTWIAYVSLGLLSFVFSLLIVRDVLLVGTDFAGWLASLLRSAGDPPVDPTRRQFLVQATNLGVLGAAGLLTGYGIYEARRRPGVRQVDIPLKNLPASFDGFRIAQITDVHAGLTIGRDWISSVAEEVAALTPDMIAFTGDMVDGSVRSLRSDVEPLGELQAPHGKFFVTGNHEYYSGVEEWVEEARRLGYTTLINEHTVIRKGDDSVVIAGVTDTGGGQFLPSHRSDPPAAFRGAPEGTTRILLAHQPRSLYQTKQLGVDLILSGHTHGGQFIPWNLLATIGQPFVRGLHKSNGTWVYVSMGTGYWGPPVRVGTRSEITLVTLRRDETAAN